jgi:hypothetical protein
METAMFNIHVPNIALPEKLPCHRDVSFSRTFVAGESGLLEPAPAPADGLDWFGEADMNKPS